MRLLSVMITTIVVSIASPALAEVDIEIPAIVLDSRAVDTADAVDEELDLANVVQSAAKGVTTVQEAPAIVTVVTMEEIRSRGYQNLLRPGA